MCIRDRYKALLAKYKGKGRTARNAYSRLLILTDVKRDSILKKYYLDSKLTYIKDTKKWQENRFSVKESINNLPIVDNNKWLVPNVGLKAKKKSGIVRRVSSFKVPLPEPKKEPPKKPTFNYFLTEDQMADIILKSTETTISFCLSEEFFCLVLTVCIEAVSYTHLTLPTICSV
eukprot:TRINITY_DN1678_c0_g1_i6.p1 TRINITY_DN1678_c0_g1~~TRINITY_DN1678_c0_g1_i6.p1  ORF type:complete len:174 (+),score=25.11 TRINITY_DN1678_c0_g1_i6:75-596(+)